MPRGDKTGPQGKGAGTGLGQGNCAPANQSAPLPEEEGGFFQRLGRNLGFGRSAGQGRGMGQGRGVGAGRGMGGGRGLNRRG